MVTIIEPSFRAYGCDPVSRQALRQRSSKLNRSLRFSDSKPLSLLPGKVEALYLSAYIYGRPLARKIESLVNFCSPALSSLNCYRSTSEKSTDHLASRRSSKYTESIMSHHRRTSVSHDPKTPATTTMAAQVHELVWTKYQDRDDVIREFDGAFRDSYWMAPAYAPNVADANVDKHVRNALKYLQGTREEINLVAGKEPIDFDSLDDLLREAKSVHQRVAFYLRRHYQDKEEGLRLPQEHSYTDLEHRIESTSFLKNVICNSIHMIRSAIDKNSAELFKRRDSRLKALDKALDRVEKSHRLAVVGATILQQR